MLNEKQFSMLGALLGCFLIISSCGVRQGTSDLLSVVDENQPSILRLLPSEMPEGAEITSITISTLAENPLSSSDEVIGVTLIVALNDDLIAICASVEGDSGANCKEGEGSSALVSRLGDEVTVVAQCALAEAQCESRLSDIVEGYGNEVPTLSDVDSFLLK